MSTPTPDYASELENKDQREHLEEIPLEVPRALAPRAVTPMELLQIAVNKDADIGKLEKLLDLQMKWEANEAKKAYVVAMNAFKDDPPQIVKNKKAAFTSRRTGEGTAYSYATLDEVCRQVSAALSKHGISHRWRVAQEAGRVKVTCVLTHKLGHSEETTLEGPADDSGSKNAIQAIGSAVTYLERYSLLASCGLAAKDQDLDGQPQMEGLQEALDAIAVAETLSALEAEFKRAFSLAMKLKNTQAALIITNAKDERKRALQSQPEPSQDGLGAAADDSGDRFRDVRLMLAEADTAEKLNALIAAWENQGIADEAVKKLVREHASNQKLIWDNINKKFVALPKGVKRGA